MSPPHDWEECAQQLELDRVYGCWIWGGSVDKDGYPRLGNPFGPLVHRIAYTLLRENVPAGRDLDHLCRRRACVNPAHLEAVTRKENARRRGRNGWKRRAGTNHCLKGHNMFEHGRRTPEGGQVCMTCSKEYES